MLDAALAVLEERGLDGFSIAQVSARSGVHETSIYRRWGEPANLVTEAMLLFASQQMPLADTGSLAGDLMEMHREGLGFFATPLGHGLIAWAVAAPAAPEYDAVIAGYWRSRSQRIQEIFERGRARGEWTSDEDIWSILPRLMGPIYFRRFFLREPMGPEDIEALVRDFLADG